MCVCLPDLVETAVLPFVQGPPLVRPYMGAAGPVGADGGPLPPPYAAEFGDGDGRGGAGRYGELGDLGVFPIATEARAETAAGLGGATADRPRSGRRRSAARGRPASRRRGALLLTAGAAGVCIVAGVAAALSGSGPARLAPPSPTVSADLLPTGAAAPSGEPSGAAASAGSAVPSRSAPGGSAVTVPTGAASSPGASPTVAGNAAAPGTLRPGDGGAAVSTLQERLRRADCYHGRQSGSYDQKTANAVAQFQQEYGVRGDPSGVYGPNTRAALESAFP
jgi:hypothetical protein